MSDQRKPRQRRTPAERARFDLDVKSDRLARAKETATRAAQDLVDATAADVAAKADLQLAAAEVDHAKKHPALRPERESVTT